MTVPTEIAAADAVTQKPKPTALPSDFCCPLIYCVSFMLYLSGVTFSISALKEIHPLFAPTLLSATATATATRQPPYGFKVR